MQESGMHRCVAPVTQPIKDKFSYVGHLQPALMRDITSCNSFYSEYLKDMLLFSLEHPEYY